MMLAKHSHVHFSPSHCQHRVLLSVAHKGEHQSDILADLLTWTAMDALPSAELYVVKPLLDACVATG